MMINMNLIYISILLITNVKSQIIFPDTFEPTNSVPLTFGSSVRQKLPFPSLNMPQAPIPSLYPLNQAELISKDIGVADVGPPQQDSEEKYWSNHLNDLLSKGVSKFALHMDQAIESTRSLREKEENIVFSPLNLAETLAVVLLGSAGKTFDEIVHILGFESGVDISEYSEVVHHMFGILLHSIQLNPLASFVSNGPEILVANGLFIQNGYIIRPEFLSIAQQVYKSDVHLVDYINQPDVAQTIINNWVNYKTKNKIPKLLNSEPTGDTKLILATALYFSGQWNQQFMKSVTKRREFFLSSGLKVKVDMMYNAGKFPYYEDKDLKIIGLPYKNNENSIELEIEGFHNFQTTMYIILPASSNPKALNDLKSKLTGESIDLLISKLNLSTCIVGLPRMKLSSTLNLNKPLRSLGLSSLFSPESANLGLLSSQNINQRSSVPTTEVPFIFSRFNDNETTGQGSTKPISNGSEGGVKGRRNNYIRYEDKNGYIVEQWDTGVNIKKNHRTNGRRRRNISMDSMKFDKREINDGKYFDNDKKRDRRQSRPIDTGFLNFIQSKGFPSYGLDSLRKSGNLTNPGLYASEVIHKVEIDITELGTEAAAASSVILQKTGNQKKLIANQPFLFFIRHNPSKLILFWGTVNKPVPNYL